VTTDQTINDTFYDGRRNFTFEQYCQTLNLAYTDLEAAGERVDDSWKVQRLLQCISDNRLYAAKTQVLETPTLKDTFEHAVNFIR
jgi:hypothetical protein